MMRTFFFVIFMAVSLTTSAMPDDTGTVSLVGTNDDSTDTKTCGLMLVLADHKWQEFEPGNDNHYFTTKKGIWVQIAPNVIILRNQDNSKRVGEIDQLNSATAKKGDKGPAKSDEKPITFHWEVQ
jgi:hypothetical protein